MRHDSPYHMHVRCKKLTVAGVLWAPVQQAAEFVVSIAQSELHPMTVPVEFVGPCNFVGQMAFRLTGHEAEAPGV